MRVDALVCVCVCTLLPSSFLLSFSLNNNNTTTTQQHKQQQERRLASALIAQGQGHIFRSWPAPGVRDAQKRALLRAAARTAAAAGAGLEGARLAALQPPEAERRPREVGVHGDARTDDYYW